MLKLVKEDSEDHCVENIDLNTAEAKGIHAGENGNRDRVYL